MAATTSKILRTTELPPSCCGISDILGLPLGSWLNVRHCSAELICCQSNFFIARSTNTFANVWAGNCTDHEQKSTPRIPCRCVIPSQIVQLGSLTEKLLASSIQTQVQTSGKKIPKFFRTSLT